MIATIISGGTPKRSAARVRECVCWCQNSTPRAIRFSVTKILRYLYQGLRSAGRRTASSTESSTLASASRVRVRSAGTPCASAMCATNGSISDFGSSPVEPASGLAPHTSNEASARVIG